MKKKIMLLFMVGILAVCFSGCDDDKEDYTVTVDKDTVVDNN